MKAPGDNTQHRVREFDRQVANRMYECMIFEIANEKVTEQESDYELVPPSVNDEFEEEVDQTMMP